MADKNPWRHLPHNTYEKHMGHENVRQLDLMAEKDHAVDILKHCDLVTANLVVKHIHLENFMDIVGRLEKPIVSVTVQYNPDGQPLSHSGYESAFADIQTHGKNCDEATLDAAMRGAGYMQTGRAEYELPNKKVFIRLDYRRQNVTIRLAVPADAPDMAEIHMRSWEMAYKDIVPAEYIREKNATRPAMWQKILAEGKYPHRVIQKNGKTVGNMCVAPPQDDDLDETCYELHGIYLHPDYFRQGIGTQAVAYAFDMARNLGKKHMTVWVFAENINSIKFYEKCGFAADGKTKILQCGKPLTAIRMKRDL